MHLSLVLLAVFAVYANAEVSYKSGQYPKSLSEKVRSYGYPFEEHEVKTPDGYVLIIHRIPYGKQQQQQSNIKRKPVFLQHGLLSSSDSFLLHEPEISLPYLLADAGFDVWLGNVRGNVYGRKHQYLKPEQPEFWNFSFDDIAKQDLPSIINYILKVSEVPVENLQQYKYDQLKDQELLSKVLENPEIYQKQQSVYGQEKGFKKFPFGSKSKFDQFKQKFASYGQNVKKGEYFKKNIEKMPFESQKYKFNPQGKLHFIGHSEGSLLGFIQFSRDKDLASKISVFVALSPIGKLGKSPLSYLLKNYNIEKYLQEPEVFSNPEYVINKLLGSSGALYDISQNILSYLKNPSQQSKYPYFFSHFPAGTSKKNLLHYSQLAKSGQLQAFDYGSPEKNQFYYKQNVPPQYNIKDLNVPVVVFYGKQDYIVGNKDFENLLENLSNVVQKELIDEFGHYDFVFHKKAKENVYDKLVKMLLQQQI